MQSNKHKKGTANPTVLLIRFTIKTILVYGATITLILLLKQIGLARAAEKLPPVSFCEIMPNPEGTDTKNNEYVKLKNNGNETVNLAGWKICNISQDCYSLEESISTESCNKIYRTNFIFPLHNDKEELNLLDKNLNLIDKISSGTAPSGKAWQCFNGYCEWRDPWENCDYSYLIPEEEPAPGNNGNSNESVPEIQDNCNNNSQEENEQANKNTNVSVKSGYRVKDKKDFSRLRKILSKKKLASAPVSIKGTVALPPGLLAKTYFYLSLGDNLIKTHIYVSCQDSPECLRDIELVQGEQLILQNATTKIKNGRFELFLDENTKAEEGKNKIKKVNKTNVSGNIVAKKGDYFFVEDAKNAELFSIYVSKPLQNAYAKKLGTVPPGYYPFYLVSTPNKSWIGGKIDASGVIETVGEEERLIAYRLNKLEPANNKSEEKKSGGKEKKESEKSETKNIAEKASEQKDNENDKSETKKSENKKIDNDQIKIILAEKLSWQSLWNIFLNKLTNRITSFNQYF